MSKDLQYAGGLWDKKINDTRWAFGRSLRTKSALNIIFKALGQSKA